MPTSEPEQASQPSQRYAMFALGLLFVVALINYVDRSLLSIMQVALKKELHLSDTELGTLTGLSFTLIYTTLALPIARLADRTSRKYVLVGALGVWTLMTAASSLARGYGSLLVCRMGVALGEAGSIPTTHSLIADFFPRHRRARAMAIWGISLPLGSMVGIALSGHLTEALGWRQTFLIIGLGGFLMTPVLLLGLREPMRGRFDGGPAAGEDGKAPRFGAALKLLWGLRSFRYLALAVGLQAFASSAMGSWNAPFYSRVHHMKLGAIATDLALIAGIGGVVGTALGGFLSDRLGRGDIRWYMRVPAIAAVLAIPFALAQYFVPNPTLSIVLALVPAIMHTVYNAPGNAMSQSLVPASMRSFTAAVYVMTVGILGGFGSTGIGILSDALTAHFGAGASLRYALPVAVIPEAAAAALFYLSSRHLVRELAPLHIAPPAP